MPRQSDLVADRARDNTVVAGQHDRILDAHGMESLDDRAAFRADFVGKGNETRELAIDRNIKAGVAVFVQRTAVQGGGVDLDVALAHEALVADMHVIAIDLAFDAKADAIFGLVAGRNVDREFPRANAQRLGDGMLQARFGCRREAQQMAGGDVILIAE